MIEKSKKHLSICRQCDLLGIPRSLYYYDPIPETKYNLAIMKELDRLYIDNPSYGSRMMTAKLKQKCFIINRKRVSRLMKIMNIQAIYPKSKVRTTQSGSIKFPYLLNALKINFSNQVWGTDITYIPLNGGYLYLVAYVDLYSRYVISWALSNSLESEFCIKALQVALNHAQPMIINSDQGIQFTSHAYIDLVKSKGVQISMSGKGKCWDNIFVERFWRTLKYEEVFLKEYDNSLEAYENINNYIEIYNKERPHSSLGYRTPMDVYNSWGPAPKPPTNNRRPKAIL